MKNKKNEKRRYFSKEKALEMINECGLEIFQAYRDGLERFNEEIQQTNPMCRTRLESTLLNAKMAESFMKHFPDNWIRGKYGRLLFNWGCLTMVIKKLNTKDKPYNIPTVLSETITTQSQASLFDGDDDAKENALLIFGYTKNRYGELVNPRIVLYDGYPRWTIYNEDLIKNPAITQKVEEPVVTLKGAKENKKAE